MASPSVARTYRPESGTAASFDDKAPTYDLRIEGGQVMRGGRPTCRRGQPT
jgi:hypothetical protein